MSKILLNKEEKVSFIVYKADGKILRTGYCSRKFVDLQADESEEEYVIEGVANDETQKIANGEIVDKTPQEITDDNPNTEVPYGNRTANITNGQLQEILSRLSKLEGN